MVYEAYIARSDLRIRNESPAADIGACSDYGDGHLYVRHGNKLRRGVDHGRNSHWNRTVHDNDAAYRISGNVLSVGNNEEKAMIYLIVFIYLLYLSIHYDILEKRGCKETHYRIAITLLILLAGLRWRVGADTVAYASDFYLSHDLFHLEWNDFQSMSRMPFWVLLNATCKTIWNDFLLVQFTVALLTISVFGYFIKNICPTLRFCLLFFFFIGKYSSLCMELLREAVAVSFVLLAIISFNRSRIGRCLLYAVLAVCSHFYAIVAIALFVLNYLFPKNIWIQLIIYSFVFMITVVFSDVFFRMATSGISVLDSINAIDIFQHMNLYVESDTYGHLQKGILQYFSIICQFVAYCFMYYKYRGEYSKYILLEERIFDAGLTVFLLMLLCRFSLAILYRIGTSYFYFWGCALAVAFTKIILRHIVARQRLIVYMIMLIIPLFFSCKGYIVHDYVYEENQWYMRYYPYSSIFDKTKNSRRENLHAIQGHSYSEETDY